MWKKAWGFLERPKKSERDEECVTKVWCRPTSGKKWVKTHTFSVIITALFITNTHTRPPLPLSPQSLTSHMVPGDFGVIVAYSIFHWDCLSTISVSIWDGAILMAPWKYFKTAAENHRHFAVFLCPGHPGINRKRKGETSSMCSLRSCAPCCRAKATHAKWTSLPSCRGPSTSCKSKKVSEEERGRGSFEFGPYGHFLPVCKKVF